MQLRHPLQTGDWMKTVSNSVRMIAPVGQTSMQLACAQCLQTSDISRKALPFPVPIVSSGTLSMNLTWRQLRPSSVPVLSRLSPRKPLSVAGSWFHSLQATSQALHPMHTLVSVKNPYDWPAWMDGAIGQKPIRLVVILV